MMQKLLQNQPSEYTQNFKREMNASNFKTVYYVLVTLLPVSLFMLVMSIIIRDNKNVISANTVLALLSVFLFIAFKWIERNALEFPNLPSLIVIHMTYLTLLFWGIHMMGYNPDKVIFVMDMVLAVFALAFLFMTSFQVLAAYYGLSLLYLLLFTPYSAAGLNELPKLMSPILLMTSAFFLSRMLMAQYIDRFIMSEKLKASHVGLTSELYSTLEKLRVTERGISNDIIRTLVKVLEYHDFYTRGHSENVAEYAVKIAKTMGFSQEQMDEILVCGLVHDIGKILIPVDLLNKATTLTPEEYKVIKKHSQYGYEMLMEAKYLKRIAKIVLHHHERWDGKGYPLGLKGDEIPLESQILMVADAWDAMTSERIYKKAKTDEVAINEMILLKGTQFAPDIVDQLVNIIVHE